MIRTAMACVAGLSVAGALAAQGAQPAAAAPAARAAELVEQFADPRRALAAIREFVGLGPTALPVLHRALRDPRPKVAAAALFAAGGYRGDVASLREPMRLLLASRQPAIALAAKRAWPGLDGARTWVVDYSAAHLVEVRADGDHELATGLPMLMHAEPQPDGNLLLTVYGDNRVIERDADGRVVFEFTDLNAPSVATRLPDGTTLIADTGNQRVIEVDRDGNVVWTFDDGIRPTAVERLGNGNTLIASYQASGAIEVDRTGKLVWRHPCPNARDVQRLPDGTTLLALGDESRVVLVDPKAGVVREWKFDFEVNSAELRPDGHLFAGGDLRVVELDAAGVEVWSRPAKTVGRVRRYGPSSPPGR